MSEEKKWWHIDEKWFIKAKEEKEATRSKATVDYISSTSLEQLLSEIDNNK